MNDGRNAQKNNFYDYEFYIIHMRFYHSALIQTKAKSSHRPTRETGTAQRKGGSEKTAFVILTLLIRIQFNIRSTIRKRWPKEA